MPIELLRELAAKAGIKLDQFGGAYNCSEKTLAQLAKLVLANKKAKNAKN